MVFYQTNNEKAWLGPTVVTDVDDNYVFVKTNGDRRKVPKCNVKLNMKNSDVDEEIIENNDKEDKKKKENFEDYAVYTVEIPTKEQNTPECNEAKYKEIENLVKFDVLEEVDDVGQERISSKFSFC